MHKQKVLLISILKPADDSRMFEKFAVSIATNTHYEVHVAGNKGSGTSDIKIIQHESKQLSRNSILRLLSFLSTIKLLFSVRPDLIITTTHESLLVVVLYKIYSGCKLCYDVQENYLINLIHSKHYSKFLKYLLAYYVRFKEHIAYPFINHYFLAEKCYLTEMPWLAKKATVIENKAIPTNFIRTQHNNSNSEFRLIYTGIIGEYYGTIKAVDMAISLLNYRNGKFEIVGFCPDLNYLKQLKKRIGDDSRISIIGGESFVSHHTIMDHAGKASLGIISYQDNPAINNKMPTRIYEYLNLELPFIIPENEKWKQYCKPYNSCFSTSFLDIEPKKILEWYDKNKLYAKQPGEEISWKNEAVKLEIIVDNLLINS